MKFIYFWNLNVQDIPLSVLCKSLFFMTRVIKKAAHEHCVGCACFDENGGSGEKENTSIDKPLAA